MKIERREGALELRGTIKDRDLQRLRDEIVAGLSASTLSRIDLSAVRALDAYLLQLLAVAAAEAHRRGQAMQIALPLMGRDLAARIGLEPHLRPFYAEEHQS